MVVTLSCEQRELAAAAFSTIQGRRRARGGVQTPGHSTFKPASNTEGILRRCQQRQYLLRKLNTPGVNKNLLQTFYFSFKESVITFSITCCFTPWACKTGHTCRAKSALKSLDCWSEHFPPCATANTKDNSGSFRTPHSSVPSVSVARLRTPALQPGCRTRRRRATFVPKAVQLHWFYSVWLILSLCNLWADLCT